MEKGKNPSPEREGTTEVGVQAIITYKLFTLWGRGGVQEGAEG